ncbi:hypothetical protein I3842_01G072000 [Carya illinoinensis]|uniref:Cyclic nucleotide-binding domain-containing protein n=1 Tax=Carya illinoinensis TaxID=32201 RepID=A0A922G0M2_CARIL|nr:hypothetical protein I3842_01G072000 [Carya illinoinensis]
MDFSRNSYLRPLPIRRSPYIPWKINEMMDNFLYPQGEFLDRWNKLFVLSCAISLALDPLFFYIPMLKDQQICLHSDRTLAIVVSVLRSVTDAFYAIHIYFKFRTVIVQPSSRVFGTVDLTVRIAKRYLSTYFTVDILAILPLPQKYTQSTTTRRVEEMMVRKTDAEQWMSRRNLPYCLRERIRQYEHYKWLETRGVEEENAIHNLPKQLRREIKRHLCFDLLMKVPMFAKMDQQLWDLLFDRLKSVVYTQGSYILREGDPVDEMLFIMRGNLTTITINGGITSFNSTADFCGEELLTWALYAQPSTKFPISTKLVVTETVVDAFVLMAEDLRTLASQFPKLHIKELQQANKTWVAAGFIQSAWRRYRKRKHERALCDAENRLQYSLANEVGASESFGATMQRPEGTLNTRVRQLLPPPSKPVEPNFNVEGDNTSQTSIRHSPNMVNIVRTEIRAALAEHRMSLLEDLEKIIMPIMTRLADMEGRMTATEEVARTRGL